MSHSFCKTLLRTAREEANYAGIIVPKNLSALKSTDRLYFIEATEDSPRVYVKGDCSYEAKARYINMLLREKEQNAGGDQKETA
jgi:hypothetical protein